MFCCVQLVIQLFLPQQNLEENSIFHMYGQKVGVYVSLFPRLHHWVIFVCHGHSKLSALTDSESQFPLSQDAIRTE
jgi:hypothetical protein